MLLFRKCLHVKNQTWMHVGNETCRQKALDVGKSVRPSAG